MPLRHVEVIKLTVQVNHNCTCVQGKSKILDGLSVVPVWQIGCLGIGGNKTGLAVNAVIGHRERIQGEIPGGTWADWYANTWYLFDLP